MINGVINIFKEAGFTSHDVVAKLRGMSGQKKIGHTGTLDPDAIGVLPICFGKATKLCGRLTDEEKGYEAVLLLGRTTDTQDTSGMTIKEAEVTASENVIRNVILSFQGEQMQIPPMYSALKKDGRRLYELAREGITIAREPRPVHFYEINILEMQLPYVQMHIRCSKGTYIRTFCNDIGEKLGCGGCMAHLKRTAVGLCTEERAITLSALQKLLPADTESPASKEEKRQRFLTACGMHLISADRFFDSLPEKKAEPSEDRLLYNGNRIAAGASKEKKEDERFRIYDSHGAFIGIYRSNGIFLQPDIIFYDPEDAGRAMRI